MYTRPTDSAEDQLAHILSEIMNDKAPIGWERYRGPAAYLLASDEARALMAGPSVSEAITAVQSRLKQHEGPEVEALLKRLPLTERNRRDGARNELRHLLRDLRAMPALLPNQDFMRLAAQVCEEALPKFDWGKSALDANAIDLLNRFMLAMEKWEASQ